MVHKKVKKIKQKQKQSTENVSPQPSAPSPLTDVATPHSGDRNLQAWAERVKQMFAQHEKHENNLKEMYKMLELRAKTMENHRHRLKELRQKILLQIQQEDAFENEMKEVRKSLKPLIKGTVGEAIKERAAIRRSFPKDFSNTTIAHDRPTDDLIKRGKANQNKAAAHLYPYLVESLNREMMRGAVEAMRPQLREAHIQGTRDHLRLAISSRLNSKQLKPLIQDSKFRRGIQKSASEYIERAITFLTNSGDHFDVAVLNAVANAYIHTLKLRAQEYAVNNYIKCRLIENFLIPGQVSENEKKVVIWKGPTVVMTLKKEAEKRNQDYWNGIKTKINETYGKDVVLEMQATREGNVRMALGNRHWIKERENLMQYIPNSTGIASVHH